jgi:hypothetical protein
MPENLESQLDETQLALWRSLDSPQSIQAYLDSIPYSAEDANRCVVSVLRDHQAHCLDGGLFAAAALERLGYPPLILDLLPEPGMDDDHVLALFKSADGWGCLAKSNFSGLRYRAPVYRTLRELVMSYFENYFNLQGERCLRGYTHPIDLRRYDRFAWRTSDSGADVIEQRLKMLKAVPLISAAGAAKLGKVDQRSYAAGMLGVIQEGLYQPKVTQ